MTIKEYANLYQERENLIHEEIKGIEEKIKRKKSI